MKEVGETVSRHSALIYDIRVVYGYFFESAVSVVCVEHSCGVQVGGIYGSVAEQHQRGGDNRVVRSADYALPQRRHHSQGGGGAVKPLDGKQFASCHV